MTFELTRLRESSPAACLPAARLIAAGRPAAALDALAGLALDLLWDGDRHAARGPLLECLLRLPGNEGDPRYLAALAVATPEDARHLLAVVLAEPQRHDPDACWPLAVAALHAGEPARAADLLAATARTLAAPAVIRTLAAPAVIRTPAAPEAMPTPAAPDGARASGPEAARASGPVVGRASGPDAARASGPVVGRALEGAGRGLLLARVETLHAHVTMTLGDWDTAGRAAEEGMRLAALTGQPVWQLRATAIRATVRALRGDVTGALTDCDGVDRMTARGHDVGAAGAQSRVARAVTELGRGSWATAYSLLSTLFDDTAEGYDPGTAARWLDLLAEAAVHSGNHTELAAVVQRMPGDSLNLGYARALLADDADCFQLALAATPRHHPWLVARIELGLGSWLRRRRRIAEARVHLAAAQRSLSLAGATAWARRAAAELRAAGVPAGESEPGVLSPQELRIARLAAQGLSNREIGLRLMLSPRTVASHLYRIFPKLEITSRTQLATRITVRPAPR